LVPRTEKAEPSSLAALADACLGYLAEHPEDLLAFMQAVGLDPDSLRRAVGSTGLQRGLIEYFAANEPILLALCANSGMAPETFMQQWHRLNPSG
jgi:translation initiation factor 2 gamma subunit (eIF-2gamma)